MALVTCSDCGHDVSTKAMHCPHCGRPQPFAERDPSLTPPQDTKGTSTGLEKFKAFSTFMSSVVIAVAGLYATNQYNSKQLEISRTQADSKITISRNTALAQLIPRLGSQSYAERKFSAISLALYKKDALPALIAALNDDKYEVRESATRSLAIIGSDAIPALVEAFQSTNNSSLLRSNALYTLGVLHAEKASDLAEAVLRHPGQESNVVDGAVEVMAILKDKRAVPELLALLAAKQEPVVSRDIAWALGECLRNTGHAKARMALIDLLKDHDKNVRLNAVWSLASIGGEGIADSLSRVAAHDTDPDVRKAAKSALESIRGRP